MDWTNTQHRVLACAIVTAAQTTAAAAAAISGQHNGNWFAATKEILQTLGGFAVNTLSTDAHPGGERLVQEQNPRDWNHHLLRASALAIRDLIHVFILDGAKGQTLTDASQATLKSLADAIEHIYDAGSSLSSISALSEDDLRDSYARGKNFRQDPAGTPSEWIAFLDQVIKHSESVPAVANSVLLPLADFICLRFNSQLFEVLKFDFDAANSPIKGGAFAFVTLDLLIRISKDHRALEIGVQRNHELLRSIVADNGRRAAQTSAALASIETRQQDLRNAVQGFHDRESADHASQNATLEEILTGQRELTEKLTAALGPRSGAPPIFRQLVQSIVRLPSILRQIPIGKTQRDEADRYASAYRQLEVDQGLPPGTLANELPGLADWLLSRPDLDPLLRVEAEFLIRNYSVAAELALDAEQLLKKEAAEFNSKRIRLLWRAGDAKTEMHLLPAALTHYEAALVLASREQDPIEWACATFHVAYYRYLVGFHEAAVQPFQEALTIFTPIVGDTHPVVLKLRIDEAANLRNLRRYAEAEQKFRDLIPICSRALGERDVQTLWCHNNLGNCLMDQGRLDEALSEYRRTLALFESVLGIDHKDTLKCRNNLGNVLLLQGLANEAEKEQRAVLALRRKHLGENHPDTLISRCNLAYARHAQRHHAEAENEFRSVLPLLENALGELHPDCLRIRIQLIDTLQHQQNFPPMESEARTLLATMKTKGNCEPFEVKLALVDALQGQGKLEQAYADLGTILAEHETRFGRQNAEFLDLKRRTIVNLASQQRHPEAEGHLQSMIEISTTVYGPEHRVTLEVIYYLVASLHAQARNPEAEDLARSLLHRQAKALGGDDPHTLRTHRELALIVSRQGRFGEAEQDFGDVLLAFETVYGTSDPRTLEIKLFIGSAQVYQGKLDEAWDTCFAAREEFASTHGESHPKTIEADELLAWIEKHRDQG